MRGAARRACALLACSVLAGCGGGSSTDAGDAPSTLPDPPLATGTAPRAPTPAPPGTPPVPSAVYVRTVDRYCDTVIDAVDRLIRTKANARDPVAPLAVLARRYRAALERLNRVTPPAALRSFHLITLAAGRESADRIDDGVRLGREGDVDAATTALQELDGILPDDLPAAVERGAPACSRPLVG